MKYLAAAVAAALLSGADARLSRTATTIPCEGEVGVAVSSAGHVTACGVKLTDADFDGECGTVDRPCRAAHQNISHGSSLCGTKATIRLSRPEVVNSWCEGGKCPELSSDEMVVEYVDHVASGHMLFSAGWNEACPYSCGGTCVMNESDCAYPVHDGSLGAKLSVECVDDKKPETCQGSAGCVHYYAGHTTACGVTLKEDDLIAECGSKDKPCPASSSQISWDKQEKCGEVALVNVQQAAASSSACRNGKCPKLSEKVYVKYIDAMYGGDIGIGANGWKEVCPYRCMDYCVSSPSHCLSPTEDTCFVSPKPVEYTC